MRNLSKGDRLREIASKEKVPNVTQLDVNNDSSVDNTIDDIIRENDRIDIQSIMQAMTCLVLLKN